MQIALITCTHLLKVYELNFMLRSITHSLKNLPAPFYTLITPPISSILVSGTQFIFSTSDVLYSEESVKPQLNSPAIFTLFHGHLPFLMAHHGMASDVRSLLVQSNPYMEPTVSWGKKMGLKIVRGGGKGDKPAMPILLEELTKSNNSVVLAVDGPSGPRYKIKRGCVELAQKTGFPIIHTSYTCDRGLEFTGRWDHRLVPLPFGKITVRYHEPVFVAEDEIIDDVVRELEVKFLSCSFLHSIPFTTNSFLLKIT